MNAKTTLSISEARKKIFEIAKEVQKPSRYYTLTDKGKPKAVIMSAEEFESIMETMEILSDSKLMANIKKAEKEYERGEYVRWEDIKKEIGLKSQEALVVREKPKKRYRSSQR